MLSLAFGARILYLSAPSLWLDEAISANIIKGSIADCIQHAKADLHPPLYYLLLHLWSFIGRDEFTLRLFSVIANFLSGVILFLCARRMFHSSVALLALLLFTLSPFQIRYSQEVRMYSLLGLWMVLVLFFAWEYLKNRSLPFLFGYIFSSALGLYTHYQA
jgi:mannosyltransferase